MGKPQRPALSYYGGKFRMADWIIQHFPEHICYVEPYGGAAGVLLRKSPSYIEVYNDVDQEVVNFFEQLRNNSDKLIRQIFLTPYSRFEQQLSHWDLEDGKKRPSKLERARRLYVQSWLSFSGSHGAASSGWRYLVGKERGSKMTEDFNRVDHLFDIAWRLKQVQIESADAFEIFDRFDRETTLFYVDPPYPVDTRSPYWKSRAYRHEMTAEHHLELLEKLKSLKGMVVLSTYPNDVYEKLLQGWEKHSTMVRTRGQSTAEEQLWLSPNALAHQAQRRML